jgi:hypothetical protein
MHFCLHPQNAQVLRYAQDDSWILCHEFAGRHPSITAWDGKVLKRTVEKSRPHGVRINARVAMSPY